MAVPAQILESQINDFTRAMVQKVSPQLTDVFTPQHPVYQQLEKHGGIISENPGRGPVRDIEYARVRRVKKSSRTKQTIEREKGDSQTTTAAQFDWVMCTNTLFVNKFIFLNTQGGDAQLKYIKERMDARDADMRIQLVEDLWSGDTVGSTPQFGIQDFIQFNPTSDPARGAVGGISVVDVPTWANQYANFNAAYATYVTGAQTLTFLDSGTNSLGSLYRRCSNNAEGLSKEGQPNLIAANEPFIRFCEGLARAGLLRQDGNEVRDFGIEGFRYKNGLIYWDQDCPDDPNDSTWGVAYLMNTRVMQLVWAKGIQRLMSPQIVEQTDGGYSWDITSQYCMVIRDRRRQGVMFGVKEATAS